jgi:hypothetical protein
MLTNLFNWHSIFLGNTPVSLEILSGSSCGSQAGFGQPNLNFEEKEPDLKLV